MMVSFLLTVPTVTSSWPISKQFHRFDSFVSQSQSESSPRDNKENRFSFPFYFTIPLAVTVTVNFTSISQVNRFGFWMRVSREHSVFPAIERERTNERGEGNEYGSFSRHRQKCWKSSACFFFLFLFPFSLFGWD